MADSQVTERDVQSLATKLATFAQGLGPGERAAFAVIEEQLATLVGDEDEDVQGYLHQLYPDLARIRHNEFMAEADRDRRAKQARGTEPADASGAGEAPRTNFWQAVLGTLMTRQRLGRPLGESPSAS